MSDQSNSNDPWYKDGLRFACTQCGNCCTGSPGYVWVNKEEMQAIADHLQISLDEFEKVYTRKVGIRSTLREKTNYDCVFLDPEKRNCTLYDLRPRQCRTWPFWNSLLKSPETWAEAAEGCPGMNKGKVVPLVQIQTQAAVINL